LKILHVYKDFDPPVRGGVERHISLTCRFQRKWAEVGALTCSRNGRTSRVLRDETPVTEVGTWFRFQNAPFSPSFPWHMHQIGADLMVVHLPNPTAELGWLLARPRGRMVVRYHSDVMRQAKALKIYAPWQRRFLEHADLILPTSDVYMHSSPTLKGLCSRCRMVPLGILPEDFENRDPEAVAALRQRYGGDFVFFAGRHRHYKGLPYLIEAARGIRAQVVVAGDGPEREACMAQAKEFGVRVTFPGTLSQADLVNHMHGCSVFVLPSVARSEAFGMAIMEAHVCGKPVVATRLGTGVEFINQDGRTGVNVPPRDAAALAEAVNALLADPRRCESMGAYARQRVEEDFHAARVARQEFELYQEVVECLSTS
jgi:glycosyltransferase involved in cell wall biosynthesis